MDVGCRKVCLCNITSGLKSDRVVTIDREYQRSAVHCVCTCQNCTTIDREYQRSVAHCVPQARTATLWTGNIKGVSPIVYHMPELRNLANPQPFSEEAD